MKHLSHLSLRMFWEAGKNVSSKETTKTLRKHPLPPSRFLVKHKGDTQRIIFTKEDRGGKKGPPMSANKDFAVRSFPFSKHTFFWCFWMVALSIIPHVRYFLDVHAWICQRRLPSAVCPTSKRERSRSLHAAEFQTPVLNSTPKNILYFTTETILPAYSHKVNWGLIFEKYSLISTEELTPGEGWSSHPQKRSGRAGSPVRDATVKIWESWKRRNKFQILFFWTY